MKTTVIYPGLIILALYVILCPCIIAAALIAALLWPFWYLAEVWKLCLESLLKLGKFMISESNRLANQPAK